MVGFLLVLSSSHMPHSSDPQPSDVCLVDATTSSGRPAAPVGGKRAVARQIGHVTSPSVAVTAMLSMHALHTLCRHGRNACVLEVLQTGRDTCRSENRKPLSAGEIDGFWTAVIKTTRRSFHNVWISKVEGNPEIASAKKTKEIQTLWSVVALACWRSVCRHYDDAAVSWE